MPVQKVVCPYHGTVLVSDAQTIELKLIYHDIYMVLHGISVVHCSMSKVDILLIYDMIYDMIPLKYCTVNVVSWYGHW